jgi:hypothetical protein
VDQIPPKCLTFLYPQGPLVPPVPPVLQGQQDPRVLPDLKVLQDPLDQAVPLGQTVLMVVMGLPPGLEHQLHLQDP